MPANFKSAISDLSTRVAELYKELVTNTVKFEEVRKYTKESITEFKRLLERDSDKIERIERERIRVEAELLSKINAQEARLNALSEQALHVAAKEAARSVMEEALRKEGFVSPRSRDRITSGEDQPVREDGEELGVERRRESPED